MKTKNIILIAIGLLITYLAISRLYYKEKLIEEKTKQIIKLEDDKQLLLKTNDSLKIEYTELEKIKQKVLIRYVEIEKKLKDAQDETNNSTNDVALFNDRKLDSVIINHKHIERN